MPELLHLPINLDTLSDFFNNAYINPIFVSVFAGFVVFGVLWSQTV